MGPTAIVLFIAAVLAAVCLPFLLLAGGPPLAAAGLVVLAGVAASTGYVRRHGRTPAEQRPDPAQGVPHPEQQRRERGTLFPSPR